MRPEWSNYLDAGDKSDDNCRLADSRHPLDGSDPMSNRWRDVHAGWRLAVTVLDGLPAFS